MINNEKIVVGLDRTGLDELLIKYAAFLADLLKAKQVTFIHVLKPSHHDDILEEMQGALEKNVLEETIGNFITKHFDSKSVRQPVVKVLDGNPLQILLKY